MRPGRAGENVFGSILRKEDLIEIIHKSVLRITHAEYPLEYVSSNMPNIFQLINGLDPFGKVMWNISA